MYAKRFCLGTVVLWLGGCHEILGFDQYQAGKGAAGGAEGSGTAGSGGAEPCVPGTEEACYTGPEGTENVGPCKGGTHKCNPEGTGYGPCVGEVTPVLEDCSTGEDEDCDGDTLDVDAGCAGCMPGSEKSCYDGPAGTLDVGACMAGTSVCDPTGTGYGPCMGEVIPSAEQCSTGTDENCDAEPSCTGAHLASKRFGDSAGQYGDGIAVDDAGNVVMTGRFSGSVDFGGGPLASAGGSDIFVAKLDPKLGHLYSRRFGDAADQTGTPLDIAVDGAGNVVVVGRFSGSVDFGGDPLTSAGGGDIFVAKLDPQLDHLYSRRFADSVDQTFTPIDVAVDSAGNVVLVGRFQGSIDFGGGKLDSAGGDDIFVVKLDPQLGHLYSRRFGDMGDQAGQGIAIDGAGNVFLTGAFAGSIDFGGGALTSAGDLDLFVAKLTPKLEHLGSKRFGDNFEQDICRVALDSAGNAVLTGHFFSAIDFGGGTLSAVSGFDIFVAKLDSQLAHLGSKSFSKASDPRIAVDGAGNMVLTGYFAGAIDFGGGALNSTDSMKFDVFAAKLDPNLDHVWSARFGDATNQYGVGIVVDSPGNLLLTGHFYGSADFGGGPLGSAGSSDIFVAKLAP